MVKRGKTPQGPPEKRIKLSPDRLAPPESPGKMHVFQRSPSPESGLAKWSSGIRGMFSNIGGDDQTDEVINGATSEPSNFFGTASRAISTFGSQLPRLSEDVGLLAQFVRTKLWNGGVVDDKRYEIESIIGLVATLPPNKARQDLGGLLIKPLWNELRHPPLSYLGDDFRYRKSDGSNNNILHPKMGAAGSSYARTVTPKTLAPSILPDAGLVFDTIFARGEQPREHPNQVSSFLFYLASIITHDIFRTDEKDPSKLKNSSYLDLSPLYGSSDDKESDARVAKVRTFKDGMLKPDTFNELRVYALPPGVAALLICFNRFHNYVASQLKDINEGNRFGPRLGQSAEDEEVKIKVDEDLFQTARLVTCGLYVNIVLHDYVRTILNLQTTDSAWTLDPRSDCESIFDEHGVPYGIGNQVSVEFNLVYRWHSTISGKDERWIEDLFRDLSKDGNSYCHPDSPKEYFSNIQPWFETLKAQLPEERELQDLKRNAEGRYDDEELVEILTESTKDVAGAFGSKNVPLAMKAIEVMGIEQARSWNVCTLNEFRKFFKLEPHRTFADITKNEEVARTLETLYSKPDYVELYPGLMAEDTKDTLEPGSGLCPGFTASRTILADAVALTRGDRFYTEDYTPVNLTNWGWNFVKSDPKIAGGGVIYKLLTRAFPSCYTGTSVYAMFPFVHPDRTKEILTKLGKEHEYDFTTPGLQPPPLSIKSHKAVQHVLKNQRRFKVPWGPHTRDLTGHGDYMLSGDDDENRKQRTKIEDDVYSPCDWAQQVREYYHQTTYQLIKSHSNELQTNRYQLDVVKDVANPSHTLFVAQLFQIPIKDSADFLLGTSTKDLYLGLSLVFAYVFLDGDPAKSFLLRANAKTAQQKLSTLIRKVVEAVAFGKHLHLTRIFDRNSSGKLLSDYGNHLIERLINNGQTVDDVVAQIIPTAAAAVSTQAQAMTHMLDIYLQEEHVHHWKDIRKCAYSNDPRDFERLQKYALEACRLAPAAFGVLRKAAQGGTVEDGDRTINYKKGDMLHADFVSASRDKTVFSKNADKVDVDAERNPDLYIHQGVGPHACLGRRITDISLAVQLGLFAKLKNLRRVPGQAGQLKYTTNIPGGNLGKSRLYMTEDWSSWWPFPTTMKVEHEGFCKNPDDMSRTDSGVSLPEIRMNGHI